MKTTQINCSTGEIVEIELSDNQIAQLNAENKRQAWELLREQRNHRLADCDWTVLSDTPTSTTAWKVYRQALRDLPANTTDPFNIVWPTPPA